MMSDEYCRALIGFYETYKTLKGAGKATRSLAQLFRKLLEFEPAKIFYN